MRNVRQSSSHTDLVSHQCPDQQRCTARPPGHPAAPAGIQDPQRRGPFTPGYARNGIIHAGRLEAGIDLLPKPFTYDTLANKIHAIFSEALRNGTMQST